MSPDDWDRLLRWFASDPEAASLQYRTIHSRLVQRFSYKGCFNPEDLADEVMDRIAKNPPPLRDPNADRVAIVHGYARFVLLDYWRERKFFWEEHDVSDVPSREDESADQEIQDLCLANCLERLGDGDGLFLLEYRKFEKGEKIRHRKAMAEARNTTLNALRLKASRLMAQLAPCVAHCVQAGCRDV